MGVHGVPRVLESMTSGVRLNTIEIKVISEGKDSSDSQLLSNYAHAFSHSALRRSRVWGERDPTCSDTIRHVT